jgi:hypothetical protein
MKRRVALALLLDWLLSVRTGLLTLPRSSRAARSP